MRWVATRSGELILLSKVSKAGKAALRFLWSSVLSGVEVRVVASPPTGASSCVSEGLSRVVPPALIMILSSSNWMITVYIFCLHPTGF